MAHIYRVHCSQPEHQVPFPLVMKVPKAGAGDGAENLVGFEVEAHLLQTLCGPHIPRVVAVGDIAIAPWIVLEYIAAPTLEAWMQTRREQLHAGGQARTAIDIAEIAHIGAAMAEALHSLHQQHCVHSDLKPANILLRSVVKAGTQAGSTHQHAAGYQAVLLDFGLSWHAHYPDLLAESLRKAVGSPAWMAPEQVVGVRGDTRSDIFALGVILYEMATGELPFGAPVTAGGLRQRMWMDPAPPRKWRADIPANLQEVILRCLVAEAKDRYQSAALVAFDLLHLDQVRVTARGERTTGTGFWPHFKRWLRAAGKSWQPSPLPSEQVSAVPIVMVALPHQDVRDATLYALKQAAQRSLGLRPGARLACVTVVGPAGLIGSGPSETQLHSQHMQRLRQWALGLDLSQHQASFHVLEGGDVADALLHYAQNNHVQLVILGAATHGLRLQNLRPTVPIRVAMEAPCSVLLVKQELPFSALFAA